MQDFTWSKPNPNISYSSPAPFATEYCQLQQQNSEWCLGVKDDGYLYIQVQFDI